jgi:hypothetical protein
MVVFWNMLKSSWIMNALFPFPGGKTTISLPSLIPPPSSWMSLHVMTSYIRLNAPLIWWIHQSKALYTAFWQLPRDSLNVFRKTALSPSMIPLVRRVISVLSSQDGERRESDVHVKHGSQSVRYISNLQLDVFRQYTRIQPIWVVWEYSYTTSWFL